MKKQLQERVEQYTKATMNSGEQLYFTKNVPDARFKNYRYFLMFHNTNKVAEAFKNQAEVEAYLIEKGF